MEKTMENTVVCWGDYIGTCFWYVGIILGYYTYWEVSREEIISYRVDIGIIFPSSLQTNKKIEGQRGCSGYSRAHSTDTLGSEMSMAI